VHDISLVIMQRVAMPIVEKNDYGIVFIIFTIKFHFPIKNRFIKWRCGLNTAKLLINNNFTKCG